MSSAAHLALVTGGAGFIGSHLVDALLAAGHRVRVLDDYSSGREENLDAARDRIESIRGDVRDADCVRKAVAGADWIFHQAAIPSVTRSVDDPLTTEAVNVGGTLTLLEAARVAGVSRFVFAASCAAYGDGDAEPRREDMPARPLSPYALQKYAGEQYCRLFAELHGMRTVALRYFNVYGPRQDPAGDYAAVVPRFVHAVLKGEPPHIYGDGKQTRDFIYVGDVVRANLLATAADGVAGRVINVADGVATSVAELAQLVTEACDSGVAPVFEAARPGEVRDSAADLGRARELLGFEPTVTLREGIRHTVDSHRGAACEDDRV